MPEPPPSPGVFRDSFTSTDVAEVEDFFTGTYTDFTMRVTGDVRRFGCRHDTVGTERFSVTRLRTTAVFSGRLAAMHGLLIAEHARSGRFSWDSDRFGEITVGGGGTGLVPPADEFTTVVDEVDLDIVALDSTEVADYAAHVLGILAEDLTISGLSPLSDTLARYWNATVAHVCNDVLDNPELSGSPIILDTAFRTLAAALLTTFPNTARSAVVEPQAASVRGEVSEAGLREVIDYLNTHADRPVGPSDIAAVAGVPAREVIRALRRRHDTSPARLLWRARLLGVRRDLLDADPTTGATVESLAARWGFDHPSRFRIAYITAFHERPEDTLLR